MLRANCLIVGNEAVGKSSIAQVFQSDSSQFPKNYSMTTSLEISSKVVSLADSHLKIEIFTMDTSGKDIFFELNSKQWSEPDMVIVVYDITDENSFNSVEKWSQHLKQFLRNEDTPAVLVGNKIDLEERRVIPADLGQEMANTKQMHYMECSAKKMENVREIFQYLAQQHSMKHKH